MQGCPARLVLHAANRSTRSSGWSTSCTGLNTNSSISRSEPEAAWANGCLLNDPTRIAPPPSTKATASTKVRCVEVFTCAFAPNHGRHEHDLPSRPGSEPRPATSCARLPSNADPSCIAFPKERCSEPPGCLGRRADPGDRRPTQHDHDHSSYKKLRTLRNNCHDTTCTPEILHVETVRVLYVHIHREGRRIPTCTTVTSAAGSRTLVSVKVSFSTQYQAT